MKKLISLFSVILMITALIVFPVHAQESETVEYLPDGSYYVTTIEQSNIQPFSSGTTSGSKITTYKNSNGVTIFTFKLTGYFTYTGSSASCTKATGELTYIHPNCSNTSYGAYPSWNQAVGYVKTTYRGIVPCEKEIRLTCDNNGNLS